MEAVRTSETSVDNHFTRQYNPEDSSELPLNRLTLGAYFTTSILCCLYVKKVAERPGNLRHVWGNWLVNFNRTKENTANNKRMVQIQSVPLNAEPGTTASLSTCQRTTIASERL
jgi:hypothetical protein